MLVAASELNYHLWTFIIVLIILVLMVVPFVRR
jgi:hypothetical protein